MNQPSEFPTWRTRLLEHRLPWTSGPIRPSDIGDELCEAVIARENLLEDAEYHKVSPNWFIVEVSRENYQLNYQPLHDRLLEQWKERLLNYQLMVNQRQGRSEFRFVGPVRVEIRPAEDLKPSQARILCSIQSGEIPPAQNTATAQSACLQTTDGLRSWRLHAGIVTLGRNPACDIYIDTPEVQRKKLVSGWHAYLYCHAGSFRLYDGSPEGRPSKNGTYVNLRRLPQAGVELNDGDQILLAAANPARPDPQDSGVILLYFRKECR